MDVNYSILSVEEGRREEWGLGSSVSLEMDSLGGDSGVYGLFFREAKDRRETYLALGEWQGGFYITPTMFGSKTSLH